MSARAPRVLVRTSASMGGCIDDLVSRALERAGLTPCECSHLILAVNAAGAARAPVSEQPHRDVETHGRDLDAFAAELAHDASLGRTIALADVAYEGGRERALEEALLAAGVVPLVHETGEDVASVIAKALERLRAAGESHLSLVTGHWSFGIGDNDQCPVPSDQCPVKDEAPPPRRGS